MIISSEAYDEWMDQMLANAARYPMELIVQIVTAEEIRAQDLTPPPTEDP